MSLVIAVSCPSAQVRSRVQLSVAGALGKNKFFTSPLEDVCCLSEGIRLLTTVES